MTRTSNPKPCCLAAEPHNCGDCYGGTEWDPYVTGSFHKAITPDYYDDGKLIRGEK